MSAAPYRADHVVHDQNVHAFRCNHCGTTEPDRLPMGLTLWLALSKAFLKQHCGCRKPRRGDR